MPNSNGTTSLRSIVAATIGLACLAGCASASPALPSATGSAPPLPAACEYVDLRGPNGDAINVSGRWRSPSGGTFYVRQAGSCVWFVGLSDDTGASGELADVDWVNSYFGTLSSDFTLRGSWADLVGDAANFDPTAVDANAGILDWRLNITEVGGEEAITLEVIEVVGGFGDPFLVKPESREDGLVVRLRDRSECPAVEADDGAVYELVASSPGWGTVAPNGLTGPDGELILPPDSIRISGEVARGNGVCGPGLIFFADQIEV